MSENKVKTIYAALLAVQRDLRAPKNQTNKFGGYMFRSAEDIIEAAKPILADVGLVLKMSDEVVAIGDRVYIKATATVIDIATGDSESTVAYAREQLSKKGSDESQITGAASSYARKYALNGLFAIDDNKDADTNEYAAQTSQNGSQQAKNSKAISRTQNNQNTSQNVNLRVKAIKGLNEEINRIGCPHDTLISVAQGKYKKSSTKDMTVGEISDLAAHLAEYVKEYVPA